MPQPFNLDYLNDDTAKPSTPPAQEQEDTSTQVQAPTLETGKTGFTGTFDSKAPKLDLSYLDETQAKPGFWHEFGQTYGALAKLMVTDPDGSGMKTLLPALHKVGENLTTPVSLQRYGEIASQIKEGLGHTTLSDLATGFLVSPVKSLLEAATGRSVDDPNTLLTPEERASAIQQTGGLAIAIAVTGGAGAAYPDAVGAIGSTTGRLGLSIAKGAAGGGAYGAVAEAGKPDALASMVTDVVMGGGLGLAHEAIFGSTTPKYVVAPDRVGVAAGGVAQIKSLQATPTTPVADAISKVLAIKNSEDLATAALQGHALLDEDGPAIITGLSNPSKLYEAAGKQAGASNAVIRQAPDGSYDVLFPGQKNEFGVDAKFYQRTGFLPAENAFHNGQEVTVLREGDKGNLVVRPLDGGEAKEVPLSEMRRSGNVVYKFDTKVVGEDGTAKMMVHGTSKSYPEMDIAFASKSSLYTQGLFFTDAPEIASGYAGAGSYDADGNLIHPDEKHIKLNIETNKSSIENLKAQLDVANKLQDADVASGNKPGAYKLIIENIESQIEHSNSEIARFGKELENLPEYAPQSRPVRLNIKNPFVIEDHYSFDEARRILDAAKKALPDWNFDNVWQILRNQEAVDDHKLGIDGEDLIRLLKGEREYVMSPEAKAALAYAPTDKPTRFGEGDHPRIALEAAGYDGVRHIGGARTDSPPHDVWIAFRNDQVLPLHGPFPQELNVISYRKTAAVGPVPIREIANSNGYVHSVENGVNIIKDAESGKILGKFVQGVDAESFINRTSQTEGPELSGDAGLRPPPGELPPGGHGLPPKPNELPWNIPEQNWLGHLFAGLNAIAPFLTVKRAYFTSLDNLSGNATKFLGEVFDPLQKAKMASLAKAHPYFQELKTIQDFLVKSKLNPTRWSMIGQYREAMSENEIKSSLLARPMNSEEIGHAQHIAGRTDGEVTNMENVEDYLRRSTPIHNAYQRALEAAEQQGPNPGIDAIKQKAVADREAQLRDLIDKVGMSPKDLQIAGLMDKLKTRSLDDVSIYAVKRLAREMVDQVGSRSDFALKNKMSGSELAAASMIDNMYERLANVFNIDSARRISGFMNHYKQYGDDDSYGQQFRKAVQPKYTLGKTDAAVFVSKLIRANDAGIFEDNPVRALARYIHAGFNSLDLNDAVKSAQDAAAAHLKKLGETHPAIANYAQFPINEYFNDIRGIPSADVSYMQQVWDAMANKIGIGKNVSVRDDVIDGFLKASTGALIGLRPMAAARDLGQFMTNYYTRFGGERLQEALRLGWSKDNTGLSHAMKLALEGKINTLSGVELLSPDEIMQMQAGRRLPQFSKWADAASQAALKWSGEQNVYRHIHAAAYSEAQSRAASVLADLSNGKLNKAAAYDKLDLHTYEVPAMKHFDDLVTSGKMTEAADFIGRATGAETAFIHGVGNQPWLWGTNPGRLFGQFGLWGMWERNFITQQLSRTPLNKVAGTLGRWTATQAGLYLAGKATGLNLSTWSTPLGLKGNAYPVSPTTDMLVNTIPELSGDRGLKKQRDAINALYDASFTVGGFRNMMVPFSNAFHGYVDAMVLDKQNYGLLPVLGRGLGFQVDKTQRSWLDEYLGNYPQLDPNAQQEQQGVVGNLMQHARVTRSLALQKAFPK